MPAARATRSSLSKASGGAIRRRRTIRWAARITASSSSSVRGGRASASPTVPSEILPIPSTVGPTHRVVKATGPSRPLERSGDAGVANALRVGSPRVGADPHERAEGESMSVTATTTSSTSYERFAGACAFAAAGAGLAYSVAFVLVLRDVGGRAVETLTALFLLTGGLLSVGVILGLYGRLRTFDPGHALLAAVLGAAGGLGAAIHGAFDLANAVNDPGRSLGLPNPVDPRGFLTFGLT